MKALFLIYIVVFGFLSVDAQEIKGQVLDLNGKSIPYSHIYIKGTTYGTYSTNEGNFSLVFPKDLGSFSLVIQAMAYKPITLTLNAKDSLQNLGKIYLEEDVLGLHEIVVTGNMREVFIKDAPVKTEIITAKYLEQMTMPGNLVQSIGLINGVQEVVACGVCYTNSLSINGLPGAYTAILVDGSPMFGSLASVYGLNGISRQIIDRIEVVKDPNATLYGSEAMAGVINIITKNPDKQPLVQLDYSINTLGESNSQLSLSPKIGKWKSLIGINHVMANTYRDVNEDGFGDIPAFDRLSVFTKLKRNRPSGKLFQWAAKVYLEDRRNGVADFFNNRNHKLLRGSDVIYGESIYTQRFELFGSYEFNSVKNLRLDFSTSQHHQDSYYGADWYKASQQIGFVNLIWQEQKGMHQLMAGLTTRLQRYDDNTSATAKLHEGEITNNPENQFIPGIFLQDEMEFSKKTCGLLGLRFDHYNLHGPILSPRINLKHQLGTYTTLRLNMGTGFKVVNIFTEDHAFVSGQRELIIAKDLKPERSKNMSLDFNHIYTLAKGQGSINVDFYYTYFNNKILPNYEEAGKIHYDNTDGNAYTRGVNLQVNYSFKGGTKINLGSNIQRAKIIETENEVLTKNPIAYSSNWSGNWAISHSLWKDKLLLAYTGNVFGPINMPPVFDVNHLGETLNSPRPLKSEPYILHNLQATKQTNKKNFSYYSGIQNLLNFRPQFSPLAGFNDPNYSVGFSPHFDTAYNYATLAGRSVYFGIRWSFK